jgi:signal transduction histidine kinase
MSDAWSAIVLDLMNESFVVVDLGGTIRHASLAFAHWPRKVPLRISAVLMSLPVDDRLQFVEHLDGRWSRVSIWPLDSDAYVVHFKDEHSLVRAEEEVKRLRLRVVTVQEDERREISQNLHDELGQGMTVLAMRLAALVNRVSDEELREELLDSRRQVDLITKRMRQLFYRIRPPALEDDSLAVALSDYCASTAHASGIPILFETEPALPALATAEATAIYRLLQESLTNVIKHARAQSVWVALAMDDVYVSLSIEDDGVGFDPTARSSGIGLAGMRDRLDLVGGCLTIDSRAGRGTRIVGSVRRPQGRAT